MHSFVELLLVTPVKGLPVVGDNGNGKGDNGPLPCVFFFYIVLLYAIIGDARFFLMLNSRQLNGNSYHVDIFLCTGRIIYLVPDKTIAVDFCRLTCCRILRLVRKPVVILKRII